MKRRLIKTTLYKLSVISLTQLLAFLFFQDLIINAAIGIIEIIRIIWYYAFDWLFEEQPWKNWQNIKTDNNYLRVKLVPNQQYTTTVKIRKITKEKPGKILSPYLNVVAIRYINREKYDKLPEEEKKNYKRGSSGCMWCEPGTGCAPPEAEESFYPFPQ